VPVFLEALVPYFPFFAGGAEIRGSATAWVGTTCPPMGRHASAFKEKPNHMREQVQ
jgi:hypothetical protein